jgi:hypothetical protein
MEFNRSTKRRALARPRWDSVPLGFAGTAQPTGTSSGSARGAALARGSLSLEKNRRTIEADVDIERSPVGQTWRVRLAQNGTVIERTKRVADREGDVELSRRLTDQPGRDKVAVRAVSAMGEVCRVTVRI